MFAAMTLIGWKAPAWWIRHREPVQMTVLFFQIWVSRCALPAGSSGFRGLKPEFYTHPLHVHHQLRTSCKAASNKRTCAKRISAGIGGWVMFWFTLKCSAGFCRMVHTSGCTHVHRHLHNGAQAVICTMVCRHSDCLSHSDACGFPLNAQSSGL